MTIDPQTPPDPDADQKARRRKASSIAIKLALFSWLGSLLMLALVFFFIMSICSDM